METLTFLLANAAGVALRVVGWSAVFTLIGLALATAVVVAARRRGFLAVPKWLQRSLFAMWLLGVPALFSVQGLFVGGGYGAAHVVHQNHLAAAIADAGVHGILDVVFTHPEAHALLDRGHLPIAQTGALFEVLPRALTDGAVQRLEDTIHSRAGDGVAGFVALRMAKVGAGLILASSSLTRERWASPVFEELVKIDDGDGFASLGELGRAIITVHAEPRVEKLIVHVIASEGLPFLFAAALLLLLPFIVARVVAWARRRTPT